MYKNSDLSYILYHNRSIENVVKHFLPTDLDVNQIIEIENVLNSLKEKYNGDHDIIINKRELSLDENDIIYYRNDIKKWTNLILESHNFLIESKNEEYNWLIDRGLSEKEIINEKLGSLLYIKDNLAKIELGISLHPILKNIINDENIQPGILFPLFDKRGYLINNTTRRINDNGKLKYTQSCPEVDVWGIDDIEKNDNMFLVEGLIDRIAVKRWGYKSLSVSSAKWSSFQLYKILELKPNFIVYWADNDRVGMRVAKIMQEFFKFFFIPCEIVSSKKFKDAGEHILENKDTEDNLENLTLDQSIIDSYKMPDFDIIEYLKNRKF